jgi:plasmid stability protein
MVMARTQTLVQLSDDLVAQLDAEAARRGVSRSALIREVLRDHLAARSEADIDRRILDGYRRIPPATPDDWAALDRLADRGAVETLQRLDEEERAHGRPPW